MAFKGMVNKAFKVRQQLEGKMTIHDVAMNLAHQMGRQEAVRQRFSNLFTLQDEERD